MHEKLRLRRWIILVLEGSRSMQSAEIRLLIREILQQEIGRLQKDAPSEEREDRQVTLTSSADLNLFARKLAGMCSDPVSRKNILNGRIRFSLVGNAQAIHASQINNLPVSSVASFDKGLLNEKIIDEIPDGTKVIKVGPRVRLTPLARDRMRQRGITIRKDKT